MKLNPVILAKVWICGMVAILASTSSIIALVLASVLPGEAVTEAKTVPVSSSGISPVGVVRIRM